MGCANFFTLVILGSASQSALFPGLEQNRFLPRWPTQIYLNYLAHSYRLSVPAVFFPTNKIYFISSNWSSKFVMHCTVYNVVIMFAQKNCGTAILEEINCCGTWAKDHNKLPPGTIYTFVHYMFFLIFLFFSYALYMSHIEENLVIIILLKPVWTSQYFVAQHYYTVDVEQWPGSPDHQRSWVWIWFRWVIHMSCTFEDNSDIRH